MTPGVGSAESAARPSRWLAGSVSRVSDDIVRRQLMGPDSLELSVVSRQNQRKALVEHHHR